MNDKKLHMREFLCATGESTAHPLPKRSRASLAEPTHRHAPRSFRPVGRPPSGPPVLPAAVGRWVVGRLRWAATRFGAWRWVGSASVGSASLRLRGGRCLRLWLGACRWVCWFGCFCVVWVCWFGCLCVVWVCWFGCLLCGLGGMVCFISFRGGWVFSFSCWRCGWVLFHCCHIVMYNCHIVSLFPVWYRVFFVYLHIIINKQYHPCITFSDIYV